MNHRWLLPLVSATAAFALFLFVESYPWQLAILMATAIGALAYSIQVTWKRMSRLARPPGAMDQPGEESAAEPES